MLAFSFAHLANLVYSATLIAFLQVSDIRIFDGLFLVFSPNLENSMASLCVAKKPWPKQTFIDFAFSNLFGIFRDHQSQAEIYEELDKRIFQLQAKDEQLKSTKRLLDQLSLEEEEDGETIMELRSHLAIEKKRLTEAQSKIAVLQDEVS